MAASKRFELQLQNPDLPELAQACALALQVLKVAKVETWRDLALAIQASNVEVLVNLGTLEISPEQQQLIRRHEPILCSLQNRVKDTRTVAVCPDCGGWFWTQSRVPSKCQIGWQCSGKPVRATATVFKKVVVDEVGSEAGVAAEPSQPELEPGQGQEDVARDEPDDRWFDHDARPDEPDPPADYDGYDEVEGSSW